MELDSTETEALNHVGRRAKERRNRNPNRRRDVEEVVKCKEIEEKMIQTVGLQMENTKYEKRGLSQGVLIVALLVSSISHFVTLHCYLYNDVSYYTYLMLMILSIVLEVISLTLYVFIHLKEDYNYNVTISVEVLNDSIMKLTIAVILIHIFLSF